jgi:hypothetical protein
MIAATSRETSAIFLTVFIGGLCVVIIPSEILTPGFNYGEKLRN